MSRSTAFLLLGCALALPARAQDHAGDCSGTWLASDSPHRVTANVRVPPGQSLTIEAGATVLFTPGTGLVAEGSLLASGTSASRRARFLAESPSFSPGAWSGLQLVGAGPHRLAWTEIEGAGVGVTVSADSVAFIDDSLVSSCLGDGIAFQAASAGRVVRTTVDTCGGAGVRVTDNRAEVRACRFVGNGSAVTLSGNAFIAATLLSATGNTAGDAIVVDTARDITGQGTWLDAGLPYLVAPGATLHVATGGLLALEGGTVLKLGAGARIRLDGELDTAGTVTAPCIFTSIDDDQGGDTNRDGATTAPGKGGWEAVEVASGGVANLGGSDIRYGNDGLRVFAAGTVTLVGCQVHHQLFRGIAIGSGGLGFVEGTSVHDCDVAVQVRDPANTYMSTGSGFGGNNHFTCDATVDVENLGSSSLDARGNYWGAAGPDASRVAGAVDTTGWLSTEPEASSVLRLLTVRRWGTADLLFAWPDTSTCSRYDLYTSDAAGGVYWKVATALDQPAHVELGAARSGASLMFYQVKLSD